MSLPRSVVMSDETLLARAVADALVEQVRRPGEHHIVLTGGGVGTRVLAEWAAMSAEVDWDRVHLWWGDERFLPDGDPQRNATGARAALLSRVPIPPDQVHPMPVDYGQGVAQAAWDYADELARSSPDGFVPDFAIVLLGMGPDGHVASLFPGTAAVHAGGSTVPVEDSPKPPPTRVSLTLPAIRSAQKVWVVAAGEAKADAVRSALRGDTSAQDVPAAAARGREETVFWLDRAAAGGSE